SPFTQRALHPVAEATLYPAAERRMDTVELGNSVLLAEEGEEPAEQAVPDDLVPVLAGAPGLVFQPDDVRGVWEEDGLLDPPSLAHATELDPFPQNQPFAFEAQRPAIAARGLAEAESELAALLRSGQSVVVAFPHRGEALRTQNLLRRGEGRRLAPGGGGAARRGAPPRAGGGVAGGPGAAVRDLAGPPRLRLARPRSRPPARPPGLPPPRAARAPPRRPRAPVLRRPAHRRLRRA